MERYNVDLCVLMTAFAMTDDVDVEIMKAHPNKFVALAGVTQYMKDVRAGKIKWSVDGMVAEYDRLLSTGLCVGVGEFIPRDPFRKYRRQER